MSKFFDAAKSLGNDAFTEARNAHAGIANAYQRFLYADTTRNLPDQHPAFEHTIAEPEPEPEPEAAPNPDIVHTKAPELDWGSM